MTNEEALNILYKGIAPNPTANNECIELCKKALEKQIPKKPKEIIVIDRKSFACPRCNEILHSYLQSYCADCGQALKWSDTE